MILRLWKKQRFSAGVFLEKGMGVGRETIMDLVGRLYEKDLKK